VETDVSEKNIACRVDEKETSVKRAAIGANKQKMGVDVFF
jgi:hypothetical protein